MDIAETMRTARVQQQDCKMQLKADYLTCIINKWQVEERKGNQ